MKRTNKQIGFNKGDNKPIMDAKALIRNNNISSSYVSHKQNQISSEVGGKLSFN